jgi:translocation and assembly module TamB
LKVLLWVFGSVVVLLILVIIALQLPPVQHFLTKKAESYLQTKLKTKVKIGEINLAFPKSIYIGDVYIQSLENDTLLFSHSLKVDVDMLGLLNHKLHVNSIKIEKLTAHVKRRLPDSSFNFSFIIKAFAGDTTKSTAKKSNSKKMDIAVYGVYLHDFYVTYNDDVSGINAMTRLGKLDIDIHDFDLDKQIVNIKKIDFENTVAQVVMFKETSPDTTKQKPLYYKIGIDEIKLASINGYFKNKVGGQTFTSNLGNLEIKKTSIAMAKQSIDIKSIDLENTIATLSLNENAQTTELVKKDAKKAVVTADTAQTKGSQGWLINLSALNIKETGFDYDNRAVKPVAKGLDFDHIRLESIAAACNDISYKATRTAAEIKQLAFIEKSGFMMKSLRSKILFDSVETTISDFDINTGNSHITRFAELKYKSLDELTNNISDVFVYADMHESIIGYRDLLFFAPELEKTAPFSRDPDGSARIASIVSGKVGDLNINSFLLTAGSGTLVEAHGHVNNLPDMNKAYFNLNITQLNSNSRDVRYFSPSNSIPKSINIPAAIHTSGYFKGLVNNFNAFLDARTSSGNATVKLSMKMPKNTRYSAYTLHATTTSLQLGRILNQQATLGSITMIADVAGTGLQFQDIDASIKAHVSQAGLMKYNYHNFNLDGRFSDEMFNGNADIKDSNIQFEFKGIVGVNPDSPVYKFTLNVDGADLQALHLMDSDFRFKAMITSNFTGNKLKDINGTGDLKNVVIIKKNKIYPVRYFGLFSATHGDNDSISIRSDFMNADFYGTIQPTELPAVLTAHLNRYFGIPGNPKIDEYEIQKFKFKIDIGRTDLITEVFYPKIQKLVTGPISGSYNSKTSVIQLDANIPEIEYSGTIMDTLKLHVDSDPNRLNYSVYAGKIKSTVLIQNAELKGKIEHDSISTALTVKDDSNKVKFMLAADMKSLKDSIIIRIPQKGVIFNYQTWQVSKDNYIKTGKEIYVHDLVLGDQKGNLTINSSRPQGTNSPMVVSFKDFNLGAITSWLHSDTLLVDGVANGTVEMKDIMGNPGFNANISVAHLTYKKDELGDIKIVANNTVNNRYNAQVDVSGNGNSINVIGYYASTGKTPEFNFTTTINKLNLATANPFTKGEASELSGAVDGKLLLSGTTDNPNITGKLHFKETGFTLDYINTHYTLHDENLEFNTKNVTFKNFTISDSADNKAVVNGYIYTKYFNNFKFDLKVKTDHFLALNSNPKDKKGELYYGKVLVTSTGNIRGNLKAPVIDLNAHLEKGTFMTVVIPRDEPSIEARKGVLYFTDIHRPPNKILYKRKYIDTVREEGIKGLEFTSNIEIDKDARLKIIVDQDAGDYLDVKGAGTLSYGMRADGTTTLTGRYEILEGSYQLTFYDFVKRQFTIQQGGSITWLGTPMNAEINLTAMYETRTAPLPILESELTNVTETDRNRYRQELRFQVLLTMTGMLKKPDLNMDITMNDLDKGAFNGAVMERLTELEQDKSELNKQVFALLVLNRFIEENPLANLGSENMVADLAYGSVSELISQQLNGIASRYLKKGHLSFDIRSYEDYSTGVPVRSSDFKGTFQEQFLDDRLVISLGSEINVQGTNNLHPEANSKQAVSDVTVEYLLTKDGRYRVLVFRDNTYAGIIEGQLVETGVGFVFVRDFDSLDKLFTKPENTTEQQGIPNKITPQK